MEMGDYNIAFANVAFILFSSSGTGQKLHAYMVRCNHVEYRESDHSNNSQSFVGESVIVGSISAAVSCLVYPRGLLSRTAAGNRGYCYSGCLALILQTAPAEMSVDRIMVKVFPKLNQQTQRDGPYHLQFEFS